MIKYKIIRSARRTVALEITPELEVLVRAPSRMAATSIESFVSANEAWINEHMKKAAARRAAHPEPDEETKLLLIKGAKEYIPQRVRYFASIMDVSPSGISITGAKTRHGSCSAKNKLCFSWRVMQYPADLVDYVIVHELAHIRHHNHSSAFYDFIASVMPDHKERRKRLKE